MDERGHRGRALHGIRKPGVEQELRRLSHGTHEEEQTDDGHRIEIHAEELDGLARLAAGRLEDGVEIDRAEELEGSKDAERKAKVADTVHDERLDRCGIG